MGDVEDHRVGPARGVLGDRAVAVLERHVPAAERHHLGAEGAVDCVERRELHMAGEARRRCARSREAASAADGSARVRPRAARRCPDRRRAFTPASGRMLSTPWPRLISSISSSFVCRTTDEVPLMTMLAELMSVPTCSRRLREDVAHGLELDAGVEQRLDDPQLEQVAVGVAAPAATPLRLLERRLDQVGPSPVVELAIRDPDDLGRVGTAVPGSPWNRLLLVALFAEPNIGVVTTV